MTPSDDAQIPLPTPDRTPPVTNTYFFVVGSVIISIITLNAFIIALLYSNLLYVLNLNSIVNVNSIVNDRC